MYFEASDVELLIHNLARARMALNEPVTPELELGSRVPAESQPAWRVSQQQIGVEQTTLLALRHQGMGWLGFLLERDRAKLIGQAILDHS